MSAMFGITPLIFPHTILECGGNVYIWIAVVVIMIGVLFYCLQLQKVSDYWSGFRIISSVTFTWSLGSVTWKIMNQVVNTVSSEAPGESQY